IALLSRTVLATLLVSVSVAAFANGGGPRGSDAYRYSGTAAMAGVTAASCIGTVMAAPVANRNMPEAATNDNASGKTRPQVRAELIQAERAGLVPDDSTHYPPEAATIERNKVAFQHSENWWRAHQPSSVTTTAGVNSVFAGAAPQKCAGLSAADGPAAAESTAATAHVGTAPMQADN
ncbi:DUF4148 domain-containing protein, partial [Burkholderia diffusa]|uniref:DUF4148 domain-containing protein n=1 Tax=Burkholderia diffusa TaxID=488732 RepID=UPI002AB2B92F